jgi:hypothetical protein
LEIEEIPEHNRDIDVEALAPGFIAFAGNGGGEVLTFDTSGIVYMLPMIGMASDCAIRVADNFNHWQNDSYVDGQEPTPIASSLHSIGRNQCQ